MKLPSILDRILPKKPAETEIFSSLVLGDEFVAAALWQMGDRGVPSVLAADTKKCVDISWEAKLDAVDEALAFVEDTINTTKYTKVVLGLPVTYLSSNGEILKDVRTHIKTLTHELELTPIGFVPLPQAILYRLKKDEGVPPSAILLYVAKGSITVSLYRVGALAGERVVKRSGDTAIMLEEVLKEFKNLEVLPARILLYGSDTHGLDEVKTELLRYPWTTRVNFLHFPKIEIITPVEIAGAVSLAGASELSHEVEEESEEQTVTRTSNRAAQKEPVPAPVGDEIASTDSEASSEVVTEETLESQAEAQEEALSVEEGEEIQEEESNVVAVDPSRLGFKKNVDVLEEVETPDGAPVTTKKWRTAIPLKIPNLSALPFPHINISAIREMIASGGKGPIIVIAVIILFVIGLLYWFVPHATVTVLMLPKSLSASEPITIDPKATSVDADKKIIPGVAQEKSVSGQKTIQVTGKKNVGNPAKGSVTIYNKSTDSKSFSKGDILTTGSLAFTLDAGVQVASASESIGSLTFGKATGTVTASQIGTDSNLPAGTEFNFKGVDTSIAIARNDAALTGGTSKSVTVVTRTDQDALVKAISADLVDKAKQDLSGMVTGGAKLIDDTITTSVTQKTFNQELDQESTELSGNATVTVSGTAYNDDDVKTLLKAMITGQIPSGYALAEGRTQVTLAQVKVGKDGKISAKATIKTDAIPSLDVTDIRKHLSGKTIQSVQEYLRSLTGVAAVEVRFGMSFGKSRLPINAKNITVDLAIQ